ncbi:hypothetical protein RF55_12970 [Lasius niger]|uniref:Reverse transcriptase domain-containing protein n=1 Tax=Lasius niger TaxID=67767 RepID=A0A0J7KBQ2_LASNI|nr:hypothetical protein RF55_12970 [Lasius niger]
MLFNILIADIEEDMEKGRWGGLELKDRRIYTLMYADDIVVMAEEEQGMKALVSRMERYLDRKGLELNVEKTKMTRFRKGGERKKKIDWRWKGKRIEEVKKFKYLDYTFKENGGQELHKKEGRRKAAIVMREVWGIVMGYGVKIWGVKERKEMEEIHERFLKWTMGVDWRMPGYMSDQGSVFHIEPAAENVVSNPVQGDQGSVFPIELAAEIVVSNLVQGDQGSVPDIEPAAEISHSVFSVLVCLQDSDVYRNEDFHNSESLEYYKQQAHDLNDFFKEVNKDE